MEKKKTSNKTGSKKITAKKISPKKVIAKKVGPSAEKKKAPKAKGKKTDSLLEHWKQRPGTFTYELDNGNGAHLVCHAKHEMTDEDLFTQYILHSTFDMSEPMKPGETKVFNAVEDPMKTFRAMFKNPPPGWMQYARGLVIQNRVQQREKAQRKLKRELAGKVQAGKPKVTHYRNVCINCHGRHWVCEDHPTLPWEMQDGSGCPCCAPGMACPDCNPNSDEMIGPGHSLLYKAMNGPEPFSTPRG